MRTMSNSGRPGENPVPPLPDTIAPPAPPVEPSPERPAEAVKGLRPGSYLINYTPTVSFFASYDGTLRIDASGERLLASGDLYQRDIVTDAVGTPALGPPPDPAGGIPVLPIKSYRYYLRVTELAETKDGIRLVFESHRHNALQFDFFDGSIPNWIKEGPFSALLLRTEAPAGFPAHGDFFVGDVATQAGDTIGQMSIGYLSSYLRKATVEIDRVSYSEPPLASGIG